MKVLVYSTRGFDKPYLNKFNKNHQLVFNKLRNLPNVIVTSHQAFLTYEALTEIAQTTLNNLNEWQQYK
jgi:lactate dehydrogenase-like 2-hydroxyacid dehydrogenase